MQGVIRTPKLVRGIDISVTDQKDVVLFVVDVITGDQILFLTSREGALRKMVSVKSGEGKVLPATDEDVKAFEKEKQFWLDTLAPVGPPK